MSPSSARAPPASAPRMRWKNPASPIIVLEARDRVGGRGHTIQAAPDITFDLGCGWLHSADENSFVPIAEQLNFEIDRTRPPWREQAAQQGISAAAARGIHRRARCVLRPRRGSRGGGQADRPRQRRHLYLEPGNRWNPMIDAISTYINGGELDRVSILDMDAYEDTEINWRVRRGYGALMAAYGATCPLALNCAGDADRPFGKARADRDLARHADGGQGDRHRSDQPDRGSKPFAFTRRCRQSSTPRAACRSGSPTR